MNALANEKLKRPSVLNILLQAYKLIVNKITRSLMNILNEIKRWKI